MEGCGHPIALLERELSLNAANACTPPTQPTLPANSPTFAGAAVEGSEHPIPLLEGDFSLNAANVLAADLLLRSGLR